MNHTVDRDRLNKRLQDAGRTNPCVCEKCGKAGTTRNIWAHVPGEPINDVVWMCIACYRAVNVPRKVRRGDSQSRAKVPPYEQMKYDYVSGMKLEEMAAKYGMKSRGNVFMRLKQRAQRRGEWPIAREVPVFAIWATVRERIAMEAREPIVYVSMHIAARYAPYTRLRYHSEKWGWVERRQEVWPYAKRPPAYHTADCLFVSHGQPGIPRDNYDHAFAIAIDDAEDWGYQPCSLCCWGNLKAWAAKHGFTPDQLERIHQGQRKTVPFEMARRLLAAVGEPIPESLVPKPPRDRPRARPKPH